MHQPQLFNMPLESLGRRFANKQTILKLEHLSPVSHGEFSSGDIIILQGKFLLLQSGYPITLLSV